METIAKPSYFPIELVERIVDYLHNSPQDLRVCALVGHQWLHAARYHLFHEVHITTASAWDNLARTVRASPDIASYIRVLYLSDWRTFLTGAALRDTTLGPLLTRLESLYVMNIHWLKRELVSYLREHFRSVKDVRFERIAIDSVELVNALIDERPSLKCLALRNIDVNFPESGKSCVLPPLEHLTMDGASLESLFSLQGGSSPDIHVKHLRLDTVMNDHIDHMARVLRLAGPSVETVAIRFHELMDINTSLEAIPSKNALFASNPSLRTISAWIPDRLFAHFGCILYSLLTNIASTEVVSINIDVDCTYSTQAIFGLDAKAKEKWDKLNALFEERRFDRLERFSLVFHVASGWQPVGKPDPMACVRAIASEQLSSLRDQNRLSLASSSTRELSHF